MISTKLAPIPMLNYGVPFILIMAAIASRPTWNRWLQEDGWVEWTTASAFIAAGVLFFLSVRQELDLEGWERVTARVVLVLLGLFCIAVAGEELSWGQRLLAYTPPDAFLEDNFQQELNLHNMTSLKSGFMGIPTESRHLVAYFCVVYGVLGPVVGRFLRFIKPAAPPWWLVPLFAVIALASWVYPISLTGEAAEMSLGLAMVSSARLGDRPFNRTLTLVVVVLLGPALAFLTNLAFSGDVEKSESARAELEQIGAEISREGAVRRDFFRRGKVHKRIFTASTKYFRFPGTEKKRYFIDPWGNPYWIHRHNRRPTIWLYSFGPNRKRDLRPDENRRRGDDVLIELVPNLR